MKSYSILISLIIALLAGTAADAKYSGGMGEPNDPYRIATAEDLNDIGNHEEDFDKHFILVNDVNLAQYTGTQFKIIGNGTKKFTGVFDGNNHKVWNFTWSSTSRSYVGLFGYVSSSGQIKNLGMENVNVNAGTGRQVGGLVGLNGRGGTITNCYSTGTVSGNLSVGGLVGENYYGTITACYSTGSVSGTGYYGYFVGGLVGGNYYGGTITNCYYTGSVTGNKGVGGLVGYNSDGTISGCYATGNVDGNDYVGGLVGNNETEYKQALIINCYSTGSVTGREGVGGLVGRRCCGTISDCYSTGTVSGNQYVGGLVGDSICGRITNCYSTGSVSGDVCVGGLVGRNYDYYGAITSCYSTGSVSGTFNYVGGLVGQNIGTITNCYSTGSVTGGDGDCVGGLVGDNHGTITNCYSSGSVSGYECFGGLVGSNEGTIVNCYCTGSVTGTESCLMYVGGLVGCNDDTISGCYSTGSVDGNDYVGGLVGFAYDPNLVTSSFWDIETSDCNISAGGTGKTTAEMKTMSTFSNAGWDFVEIWGIGENQTYPFLLTDPAGDLDHDKKVDFVDLAILASHWLEER